MMPTDDKKNSQNINEPQNDPKAYHRVKSVPMKPVTNGMVLWLDATDNDTIDMHKGDEIANWRSKHAGSQDAALTLRSARGNFPMLRMEHSKGVYFDYNHFGIFTSGNLGPLSCGCSVPSARTIVSLHSFIYNQDVPGAGNYNSGPNGRCVDNFYIFCDSSKYYFHGQGDKKDQYSLIGGPAHGAVHRSTLRLGLDVTEINPNDQRAWDLHHEEKEGNEQIAILSLPRTIEGGMNRIGRDRGCHHFCGVIHELIVYDRALSNKEKSSLQQYVFCKHYGFAMKQIEDSLDPVLGNVFVNIIQKMVFPPEIIGQYRILQSSQSGGD